LIQITWGRDCVFFPGIAALKLIGGQSANVDAGKLAQAADAAT
jgi:hypothetical protein